MTAESLTDGHELSQVDPEIMAANKIELAIGLADQYLFKKYPHMIRSEFRDAEDGRIWQLLSAGKDNRKKLLGFELETIGEDENSESFHLYLPEKDTEMMEFVALHHATKYPTNDESKLEIASLAEAKIRSFLGLGPKDLYTGWR